MFAVLLPISVIGQG